MTDPLQQAASLTQDERRILQVLSVVYEPVNQTTLKDILSRLGWKTSTGASLATLMAKPLRERLLEEGLIAREGQGLVCGPGLAEVLTRETLTNGTFREIRLAGEALVSSKMRYSWESVGARRLVRRLRDALYSGNSGEVRILLQLNERGPEQPIAYREVEPLVRICTSPADVGWFLTLPRPLQFLVLGPALSHRGLQLESDPDLTLLMDEVLVPALEQEPHALLAVAEQRLFQGRVNEAAAMLSRQVSSETLPLIAWLHLVQGRHADAREVFELLLERLRKQTRKRNLALSGLPGILHLLTLLRSGDPLDLARVQSQAGVAMRAGSLEKPLDVVFRMLSELAHILAGHSRASLLHWIHQVPAVSQPFDLLFYCLVLHWLGERPTQDALKRLAVYCQMAADGGFHWYAWEGVELLRVLGRPLQVSDLPPVPDGISGLAGLLRPKPEWELALDALKGLGVAADAKPAAAAASAAGPGRRMCWLLSVYGTYGMLEPREQKRTKGGGWTQGRAVALQKLAETPDDYDYLTPQDRRICAMIQRETETGGWYGYGRTRFTLESDAALLAAVGHPLVFRAGHLDAPVELVRTGPALEVVNAERDILVRMNPFPADGANLLLVSETSLRIRLVQFDASHRRIAAILGEKGLTVPTEGKDKLLEGIAAIAPLLTVHSAIGGGERMAETCPADSRPYLFLQPLDAGLGVDLFMCPLGDKGPRLLPGQGLATLFAEVEGRSVQTQRDLAGERREARAVLDAAPNLSGDDGWSWVLDDMEQALSLLEQLRDLGDAVVLNWPEGKRIGLSREHALSNMRVSLSQGRDWLGLEGGLELDDGQLLAMRELLDRVAASKGRFVRLDEREYLVLSEQLRKRLDALRGLVDQGRFHPLAAGIIDETLDGMEVKASKHWRGLLARLAEVRDLEPAVPSTLQADLRDYQLEGFRWLARLAHWGAGACLADDMGLGKTVQALALILSRATQGPTLVLAPMSVCANWLAEALRFAPTLQPKRFGEGDREQMLASAGPFDLVVCSYGLLQAEGERLAGVEWATIVADEAQAFKNAMTKRSQAMMKLQGGFRLITTGTPIENHLGELWNLFRFINPGLLGSLESFNRRFATPIEQHGDSGARQRLRQLLRPFILRRLKTDVLSELPPRTEITLELELGAAETALYESMRQRAIERLETEESSPGQKRMQLLAEIMRLRRVCCHPKLALPDSDLPSAKLDAFDEILDELLENRHKALVFSQFVDHLSLIRAHLDARGVSYQYLDGSTPEPKRKAAVAAFQAGEGDLFLISLRAGGSGLNLTAADYVIHMDPWWNPSVEDQASDRAHRMGQERPVTIYRLVTKGTIEERIIALHASKRDLADGLLDGAGDGGRLSYEDMLALIREQVD